jgi:hypothetical protein
MIILQVDGSITFKFGLRIKDIKAMKFGQTMRVLFMGSQCGRLHR